MSPRSTQAYQILASAPTLTEPERTAPLATKAVASTSGEWVCKRNLFMCKNEVKRCELKLTLLVEFPINSVSQLLGSRPYIH